MLSHDFARALLARRNHDLRFITEVCLPGRDGEADESDLNTVTLRDAWMEAVGRSEEDVREAAEGLLQYDSENDFLNVFLGPIYAGRQGAYCLDPGQVLMLLKILKRGAPVDPQHPALLKLRKALEDAV